MWLAATAGRHRVRLMSTQQGLGPQIGVGVVFSDRGIEGTSHTVGFRSHTAAGLDAPTLSATQGGADGAGAAGWVQAKVAMVARAATSRGSTDAEKEIDLFESSTFCLIDMFLTDSKSF